MINYRVAYFILYQTDFGVDALEELAGETNFPWLLSNVMDNLSEDPLANGLTMKIIEWQGIKVIKQDVNILLSFTLHTCPTIVQG